MPRPSKDVVYNADRDTIRRFFERAVAIDEEQKGVRSEMSELNRNAEDAGVHSGVLSMCRRIRKLKPGRRGYVVALTRRYLDILADELQDPQLDIEQYIAEQEAKDQSGGGEPAPSGGDGGSPPADREPRIVTPMQSRRGGGNGSRRLATTPGSRTPPPAA